MIKLDISNSSIDQKMINKYADKVAKIHEKLHEKADDEKEFLGWIKLPTNYDKAEFERIKKAAKKDGTSFNIIIPEKSKLANISSINKIANEVFDDKSIVSLSNLKTAFLLC